MKCNKQLEYSKYVVFSHFHDTDVNNSGQVTEITGTAVPVFTETLCKRMSERYTVTEATEQNEKEKSIMIISASRSQACVERNRERYDPASPILCGAIGAEDIVRERSIGKV